jgi:hypothetical protein
MNDPSTAKSCTGYIVSYGGCPVIWTSKLQTEVVLSSTESEFVGLSESLCIAIIMMNLLKEMQSFGIPISKTTPTVYCKLFEDNAGAIQLAKVPKMRPRTRHINQKSQRGRVPLITSSISLFIGSASASAVLPSREHGGLIRGRLHKMLSPQCFITC